MVANGDGISSICFTKLNTKNKMTKLTENYPQGTANIADYRVLANVILSIMKKESNHDLNNFQCGVYSSFGLACKINTEGLTAYKVRKELKILESKGYVKKSKFHVDNESNLMCWQWHITIDGYNIC